MVYPNALAAPPRYQWESNSGSFWASQSNNCGPTCATRIACFYRDTWFGIEPTRRAVMACCVPTAPLQQRAMLAYRGVPASVISIDSLSQFRALNPSGNRPFIIGIKMSRVPASVRDHPFLGWHALCVLDSDVWVGGVHGAYINDPNFSPPGGVRPDPDRGKKFYPDWVIQYALIQNTPRWAIVPNKAKVVTATPVPPPPPVTSFVADGDPAPMRYRRTKLNSAGAYPALNVKPNKPVRKGALLGSGVWSYTGASGSTIRPFGYIAKEDLPSSEQGYGNVYLANWYFGNGDHIGYIKAVDIA